jgi:transcription elongation factor Elf1
MLYSELAFVNRLQPYLRNFKQRNSTVWNFACPLCGDSTKDVSKARGYIYQSKHVLWMKCHNCGVSLSFSEFLKRYNNELFHEYLLQRYQVIKLDKQDDVNYEKFYSSTSRAVQSVNRDMEFDSAFVHLLGQLDQSSAVWQYVNQRQLPIDLIKTFYYTDDFQRFVNTLLPGKFIKPQQDPRLIIPYKDYDQQCFAFQGRSIINQKPKYYTIKLDSTKESIFGLDRVNFAETIYVTEGPLDSLFLPNALAVSGSTFTGSFLEKYKRQLILVYDNEPRSPTIISLMNKAINYDYNICIWPDYIKEKDINEMIISGYTSEQLCDLIKSNTYNGLTARAQLSRWKKCG